MPTWAEGQSIVRREVWRGRTLSEMPVTVVRDEPGLLAVYLTDGAPFTFPKGDWPAPHP